jgi:protein tyrosine/serine phosphatase
MSLVARLRGSSTASIFVAVLLTCPSVAHAEVTHTIPTVGGAPTIRIDNFGQVTANYYRGAQPEGRDYADLAALGVKTVIDLTSDDNDPNERRMTEQAGMKYVRIPMTTHEPPTSAQLGEFLRIVNDSTNEPVYVHCVGGRHRTGVMTAAYRMTGQGWTADAAFREMKTYNFGADFLHAEFKAFVYAFDPAIAREASSASITTTSVSRTAASAGNH